MEHRVPSSPHLLTAGMLGVPRRRERAECVSSAAQFQGKFALSQLLKQNVSECQMPGATYALHKRGSINQGAVSGKKSGSKEESSGIRFLFHTPPPSFMPGQRCLGSLCGAAVKESITLSPPPFFFSPGSVCVGGGGEGKTLYEIGAHNAGQKLGGWWLSWEPGQHSCDQCQHSSRQYGVTLALFATCFQAHLQ